MRATAFTPQGSRALSSEPLCAGGSRRFDYTFGAVMCTGDTVRFRVWAPDVAQVLLEVAGQPPRAMASCGDGYHQLLTRCSPGARYRYRMSADIIVPDPASRLQDGDVHDASVVVDDSAYCWHNADWRGRPWVDTILYEIHCGLAGGFAGVERRLVDLAKLGVTAIELMPVADFSGARNWGYDGVLPYAPDSTYGTPDNLRHLVDAAHEVGLMVFLDVVYNHFGPDGNYLPLYAKDFFRADLNTPWGPVIDFRQQAVRAFFAENALYWLREYRFDGLRLDAVHAIIERDWLTEMARFVRSHVEPGRYIHLVIENNDNTALLMTRGFDGQWNDDAHHIIHHLLTGEAQGYYAAYQQQSTQKLARFLADGFIYQGEPSVANGGKVRGQPSAFLPPTSFVFFLQNHDQIGNRALGDRLITLCGPDLSALRAAVALQLLTPHIPLLFMGEEYGARTPFLYFTGYADPSLARAVHEGRRDEFASFAEPASQGKGVSVPDPNDIKTWENSIVSTDEHDEDARDWHDFYRRLFSLRKDFITAHLKGAHSAGVDILGLYAVHARWVLNDDNCLLNIYCNLSQSDCGIQNLPALADSCDLFTSKRRGFEALHEGLLLSACTVVTLQYNINERWP